jgi:hypothetical protein
MFSKLPVLSRESQHVPDLILKITKILVWSGVDLRSYKFVKLLNVSRSRLSPTTSKRPKNIQKSNTTKVRDNTAHSIIPNLF